jgi:hypothetical protein
MRRQAEKMIQAKKLVEALAGLVLTVVETAFLATYNLLPWNPGTRPWLVAGGVFGLLVGVTIGLQIPLTTGTWRFMITRIATPGLVGAAALFGLNTVVYRLGSLRSRVGEGLERGKGTAGEVGGRVWAS